MMVRAATRRRKGYSLIELVAALTIFSIAVLGAMEVFSVCLRSTASSLGYTHAVFLCQGLLEETIAESSLTIGSDTGDFGTSYEQYSWSREIEDTEQNGLTRVHVVVNWTERGREKEYTLTTLVAERSSLGSSLL